MPSPIENPRASARIRCVLLADDLTGACDAAVQFSLRGARAAVYLELGNKAAFDNDVLAFSTNSRNLQITEIESRIRAAAVHLQPLHPEIVFKKIDSTLRGNPGAEIATALEAFHCELAIIAPAFPDMGRIVRDGQLHLDGDETWQPIEVAAQLRAQGLTNCAHAMPGAITAAIGRGHRYISLDTICNEDLETIVTAAVRSGRRILWAGSGGLASALACALFARSAHASLRPARNPLPVLFCIGSNHPVTAAQLSELISQRAARHMYADSIDPRSLAECLSRRKHAILTILRGRTSCERLRFLLPHARGLTGALLLSGGDTASLVFQALDAPALALSGEISTGLPWGILRGGSFEGLPVATKSGAFGRSNALIQVADFFTCPDN